MMIRGLIRTFRTWQVQNEGFMSTNVDSITMELEIIIKLFYKIKMKICYWHKQKTFEYDAHTMWSVVNVKTGQDYSRFLQGNC